jgi:Ca2+-binding EF-hand superfamily protein
MKTLLAFFFPEIGKLNFDSFCRVAMHFLDDEDNEVMQKELKEAFRLYDKDGEYRRDGF